MTDVSNGEERMIQINYDGEGDILEIRFSDDTAHESEYIEESGLVVDYDALGNLVGVEMLSFSKRVKNASEIAAIAA